MKNKNARLYRYGSGLFFDYWVTSENFQNSYFNDQEWKIKEQRFAFVRLEPKWFGVENWYYDGHTAKSITILGVTIGVGYTYDSRPLEQWGEE